MRARFVLAAAAIGLAVLSGGASAAVLTYQTTLSGPAEEPPVASPGLGAVTVVVDTVARNYSVSAMFFGLIGPTTVAHIHGPTATPGSGLASVITMPGTFPGFPVGVTSGSFSGTFATDDAASYTATFLGLVGNDVDAAEAGFLDALASGRAYFNIHTAAFPSGEIRGFLRPAAIPLPAGGLLVLTALGALGALRLRRAA